MNESLALERHLAEIAQRAKAETERNAALLDLSIERANACSLALRLGGLAKELRDMHDRPLISTDVVGWAAYAATARGRMQFVADMLDAEIATILEPKEIR